MKESSEVREFYDEFAGRVLVRDFYYINRRHEAIKALCDRFVSPGSSILEIGCGVGIITKYLGRRAAGVFAVDISAKNIEIAREFAGSSQIRFEVIDVLDPPAELDEQAPFDIVILADVIEHIPKSKYRQLFGTIERVLKESGRVVLSFPSPEVQAYMASHQPDDIQVIDESIEAGDILSATSLKLLYFSYCDIFGKNDYVHAVLTPARPFAGIGGKRGLIDWFRSRIRKYRWRAANRGFLRRLKQKKIVT